jgi:hypothetical protein
MTLLKLWKSPQRRGLRANDVFLVSRDVFHNVTAKNPRKKFEKTAVFRGILWYNEVTANRAVA